jgi:hypothetical protein
MAYFQMALPGLLIRWRCFAFRLSEVVLGQCVLLDSVLCGVYVGIQGHLVKEVNEAISQFRS